MKKLLLAGAVLGVSFSAQTQIAHAVDATGNASALIRSAITLVEDTAMDFGTITPDPTGDVLTIDTADTVSAVSASDLAGTPASGAFSATGDALSAVTIAFSTGDTLTGPGAAMALDSFTTDAGGSPAFDGAGDLTFNVGADLTVGAAQAAGLYNGTYTVSVNYN